LVFVVIAREIAGNIRMMNNKLMIVFEKLMLDSLEKREY